MGHYSEAVDVDIEQAYQSWDQGILVEIGIRQYLISFGPEHGFARQIDVGNKKLRLVRRCLTTQQERARLMASNAVHDGNQDMWTLCLEEFQPNMQMPVVAIPEC